MGPTARTETACPTCGIDDRWANKLPEKKKNHIQQIEGLSSEITEAEDTHFRIGPTSSKEEKRSQARLGSLPVCLWVRKENTFPDHFFIKAQHIHRSLLSYKGSLLQSFFASKWYALN